MVVSNEELPANWDSLQEMKETTDYAKKYFENDYLGFIVPSVIINKEKNIVLNPRHPRYSELEIIEEQDFNLDKRFY